jgi:outer membrane biosynthesis protein TonB
MNSPNLSELPERKRRKPSRISFFVSLALHIVMGLAIFYVAARQGILGKKMKEITAVIVPKDEKKPEPQKPKDEPKVEQAKPETARTEPAKTAVAAPPVTSAVPPPAASAAAPPPTVGADFDFNDGAKVVQTTSNPVELYKQAVEYAFRSRWIKPDAVDDTGYVAEIDVSVAPDGRVTRAEWKRGSGDNRWDASVRDALKQTANIGRKPPKEFPGMFLVRFDAIPDTEPVQ